jgi:hypothetical protein
MLPAGAAVQLLHRLSASASESTHRRGRRLHGVVNGAALGGGEGRRCPGAVPLPPALLLPSLPRRPLSAPLVGPGEKLVLLAHRADTLCVWRKFRSMDSQQGVNCAVIRNESPALSSARLREACATSGGAGRVSGSTPTSIPGRCAAPTPASASGSPGGGLAGRRSGGSRSSSARRSDRTSRHLRTLRLPANNRRSLVWQSGP